MRYYNSSLGTIQFLLDIPFQKGMYDLYKELGEDKASTYLALGIANMGCLLSSFFIARSIYDKLYDSSKPTPNKHYITSFYTEHLYDHNKKQLSKIKSEHRELYKKRMDNLLKSSRKYESSLVKTSLFLYGISSTFGASVAYGKLNYGIPKSLAYGFFMPASVIYRDFYDRGLDSK